MIRNLNEKVTEAHLRELLEDFGLVYLRLMTNHQTGESKGTAFVQVGGELQGRLIIRALDGFSIMGKRLSVTEVTERNPEKKNG